MPFGVAVVHAHQDDAWNALTLCGHLRLHALVRRQVGNLAAREIHAVQMPVLVAALVPNVEHMFAVQRPEMRGDAAARVVRDGSNAVKIAALAHPEIHDAVQGRAEAHLRSVRTQSALEPHGVAEQDGPFDQRRR
jgi:hypothetical protein